MRSRCSIILLLLFATAGCSPAGKTRGDSTPESINAQKDQAHSLMAAGRYQAAIAALQPLEEAKVKNSQLYSMLAECYWRLGAYDQATARFEVSLRFDYADAETHSKLAQMLMETGRIGRALTEFELAIRYGERNALDHYNYGLALYEFGRKEQARVQWELAYAIDPQDARYAQALGMGYSGVDDDTAGDYFARAAELGANDPKFHNNYGLLLMRTGRLNKAGLEFEAAITSQPDVAEYRANMAALRMTAGRFSAAIPLWETLLKENPENRTYRIYLGKAYYETERFDDAVALLEEWLAEPSRQTRGRGERGRGEPRIDEAFDTLAMSFRGLDDLDKAERFIGQALALDSEHIGHLINYGVILAENGKVEKAKTQWLKALSLDPDNKVARQNLSAFGK